MPTFTLPDGAELHLHVAGDAANGTALFVHPFMHDGTLWLDQLKGLSDMRRCVAVDMRGHGRSDPNPNPSIVDQEHLADLLALVDALEGPLDLVGLAFAGNLCAMIHEQRPERVRSLTMISSGFGGGPPDPAYQRYCAELGRLVVIEGKDVFFRRSLEYIMSPSASLYAKARYRSILERTPAETLVAYLVNGRIGSRPDLPAKLNLPVFIPMGSDDPIISLDGPLSEIPDLRTERMEAVGRLLPIEAPEALNAALRRFWTSIG